MFLLLFSACTTSTAALHTSSGGSDEPEESPVPPQDDIPESVDDAPGKGFPFDSEEVFEIALEIPQSSIDKLGLNAPYVPGTFHYAGLEHEVALRYKGASTYDTLKGKPSFKLNFGEYDQGARFLGLERLTLNAMKFDPTMMREAVAYHFFQMQDVPAPRHAFAHLTINGDDYGIYGIVESLDEHFLSRNFPDDSDGNLYDTTFISSDLTALAANTFVLQEGDPTTAQSDISSLIAELDAGNIFDILQNHFDPGIFDFLATDLAAPNYDGYSRNTNNFLVYHAMPADRWSFIPWGQDQAFYGAGPNYGQIKGRLTAQCVADVACKAELDKHVFAMADLWEQGDLLGWAQSTADMISPGCEADARKLKACDQQQMLDHLAARPAEIRFFMPL